MIGVITKELVIEGLKFIAEHQKLSYIDMKRELYSLGCDFTLEDVEEQFMNEYNSYPFSVGLHRGYTVTGAIIIANVTDSSNGLSVVKEKFLSTNDENSIYHFIRVATSDPTYTLSSVSKKVR